MPPPRAAAYAMSSPVPGVTVSDAARPPRMPAIRSVHLPLPALLAVVLLLGIVVGYALRHATPAPPLPALAALAAPAAGEAAALAAEQQAEYALLREITGVLARDFFKPEEVEPEKLLHGAARGMVQALEDPNSLYETPAEREAGESRWTGRYEGVGMYVDQKDGKMVVTSPIEGGPAHKAGVRPGDVILKVNGQDLSGRTLTRQTLQIRGPKGTVVVLTIQRQGVVQPFDLAITRDEIRIISARERMIDDVGVLRIAQFSENTPTEARAALETLLGQKPRALILDLRANAGGLLVPAVEVAGFFLGPGPVVQELRPTGEGKLYESPDNPALTDLPLLVLVDKGTASASEILAATLRERGRAELMGEPTYGKSTVQYLNKLSDGSGLRVTVAQWHTPSGAPIPASGLAPDRAFPFVAAADPSPDQVLEAVVHQWVAMPAGS